MNDVACDDAAVVIFRDVGKFPLKHPLIILENVSDGGNVLVFLYLFEVTLQTFGENVQLIYDTCFEGGAKDSDIVPCQETLSDFDNLLFWVSWNKTMRIISLFC